MSTTTTTSKPLINPFIQAKLLKLRIMMGGIARDYWKDAPMPWPRWALAFFAKIKGLFAAKPAGKTSAKPKAKAAAEPETEVKEEKEVQIWSGDRVSVMEAMWGEGQTLPGGLYYVGSLTSPLGVTNEMSVLDLGAGLGGLARHLVEQYKTYVTGLEMDSNIAARGMVMSIAHGKSKTASILVYDPANFTPTRKYDVIIAREVFSRVIGKEKFFKAIDASLKTGGGQLVFTDYILNSNAREKPAVAAWLSSERGVAPLSLIEMIKIWKGLGYDLRIAEDQTSFYKTSILAGLRSLGLHMVSNTPDGPTKQAILGEINLWSRRMAAFQDGLKYYRFYAIKH